MRSPSYVGQRFHKLTVLSQYSSKKHLRLVCKCDCGNTTDVRKSDVIGARAETKSCGCWRHSPDHPANNKRNTPQQNAASKLWLAARERAKKSGLEFTIEKSDIHIPDTCSLLDIPIKCGCADRHHSPSLDRKDNTLGYTPENTWIISSRANTLKNNATGNELLQLATKLKELGL